MSKKTFEFSTEDIEYLRHGDKPLMLRLYKPAGQGPFPALVDVHGGAWSINDLNDCRARDEVLAKAGLLVAGLNFRHAGDGHLASMADINYAIRWLKAHAAQYHVRADLVGISGQSSGGHLAMLAAMRPSDPRYASVPLPAGLPRVDATVRCVAMSWPVINPLSRYRNARRARASTNPPAWVGDIPERHDLYWKTEENMAEGNPLLALERGEKVMTPPALWLQGRPDPVHDYHDPESDFQGNEPERFATRYRHAGGEIEISYIDQAARSTAVAFDAVAAFFHKQMPAGR